MFFGEASAFRRTSTFGHAPGAVLESEPRPGGLDRGASAVEAGRSDHWTGLSEGDTALDIRGFDRRARVSPGAQQRLHHRQVPVLAGLQQRRAPAPAGRVHVRLRPQQRLDGPEVPVLGGQRQGRHAEWARGGGGGLGLRQRRGPTACVTGRQTARPGPDLRLPGLTAAQTADDPPAPPRRWWEGDTAAPAGWGGGV